FLTAISTLTKYILWHQQKNIDLNNLKNTINQLKIKTDINTGGIIDITKKEIDQTRKEDFEKFSKGRHSIRDFDDTPVLIKDIEKALEIAKNSPSACNRQPTKTYVIQNGDIKKQVLKLQRGNRGFGHLSEKLLIITSDLSYYQGADERNQSFIDGGIFSMSLMYSLHYVGIDSCALGWIENKKNDLKLREIVNISNSENIILILAIGHMRQEIKITKSTRKPACFQIINMKNKQKEKIGILTFHDGINHGAYLQAYALQNFLEKSGYPNKIINYKKFRHWIKEYKCFLYRKKTKDLIDNVRKIIKFKRSHRKFKLTRFTFSHKKVSKEKFDTVIIGSDEVWNFHNALLNYDSIYFGNDLNAKKVISYATSFGAVEQIEENFEKIKNDLNKFKNISVRDENSFNLVKKLTGREIPIVLDPIFLYDFSKEKIDCPYEDYILIYGGNLDENLIKEIKKTNKKIISIGYQNSWADINVIDVDPFEWLGYFKNASMVITTMFHGLLFAIKYNKNFCLIVTRGKKNKFTPIIDNLCLNSKIYDSNHDVLKNIFSDKINYDLVNKKLDILIKQSKEYLLKSLNENNN
ncbi:polysaccharide pyruvyl transferase family protein, partial [Patescibacteria group bacterium]|nr:polysaccharide pyruvyl transferase family protein [Patescibacteria group bacterium]